MSDLISKLETKIDTILKEEYDPTRFYFRITNKKLNIDEIRPILTNNLIEKYKQKGWVVKYLDYSKEFLFNHEIN